MALARRDLPRKAPRQARAQTTVDAILRATAHILKSQGYDGFNTNAVAKKAGVSIGSLYQYFPSKDALVAALAEQHAHRAHDLLLQTTQMAAGEGATISRTVRQYIRAIVAMHQADPVLHRVLSQQVPRISSGWATVRETSERAAQLVRAWLQANRSKIRAVDLDVATYLLVTTVEAAVHL